MQGSATSTGGVSPAPIDTQQRIDYPLWYRDAVIYQLHVRGFFDSNDDGIGEFRGLTQKLDYIQSLGVTAVWLQPFYPSPLRDDGYDIADYRGVHPSYGTRRDFLTFMNAAHDRGLRVITELVINHTSDQHQWFQAARRAARGTTKRDFYVWSDTDQKYAGVPIVFKDTERSNWTWDPVAGQYFWHRFFFHQPDLNYDNPMVLKAVLRVMRFWLDMGVDGMRLDAVPYLVEREGTQCANLPETHAVLKAIRRELDSRYPDRMLLAEANQWPSDVRAYFGDGDECHMAFHFPLMPRLFMALRQEDRHPISEILYQMPEIPEVCQWAIFLRNHDELTLEMVSDEERDYMYQAYAADPQMRLNAGIRRRLAPLMENSRPRIELLTGLLLSLPGTPVLYYGDELGMGDNVYLGDRNGVRTPMQWNADRNGGFSRADPARLYAPLIMDSIYGYGAVNVEAQDRSPHSLLAWMRRIISLRQSHVATFGRGSLELLRPANRRILAFIRRFENDDPVLVVANLSRAVQPVALDLARLAGLVPVEMSGGVDLPRITDAPYALTLGPFAFYWFRLQREAPSNLASRPVSAPVEDLEQAPLLVGPEWWKIFDTSIRTTLERRHLSPFLPRQPWFERRTPALSRVTISDWGALQTGDEPVFIVVLTAEFADGVEHRYIVPVAISGGERAAAITRESPDAIIVPIGGARNGVMHTRLDGALGRAIVNVMLAEQDASLRYGRLLAKRLDGLEGIGSPRRVEDIPSAPLDTTRFRSHATFGERLMLEAEWRAWPGPSPELETLTFLTRSAGFARVPAPVASLDYVDAAGDRIPAALVTTYLPHQSDAWRHTLEELSRFLDAAITMDPPKERPGPLPSSWTEPLPASVEEALRPFAHLAGALGHRLGELHLALSQAASAPAGSDSTLSAGDLDRLVVRATTAWERARAALIGQPPMNEAAKATVDTLVGSHDRFLAAAQNSPIDGTARLAVMRVHGTLDLTHVLIYEGDVLFIGPEEDPAEPPDKRRRPDTPLVDVASLLWSLQNASTRALAVRPATSPPDYDRLAVWAQWWVAGASRALLASYRRITAGTAFVPEDAGGIVPILRLSLFERAFHDISRIAIASPEWLGTSAAAALALVDPKS
jgi:maltose alpha-D-glucosyltransferase/alpha-amylase